MSRRSTASLTLALSLSPWAASAQLPPVRVGAEFQVNAYTTGDQATPVVAATANGGFVVVWTSSQYGGSSFEDVFARRYDGAGAPQGAVFRVNNVAFNAQNYPAVASDPNGNFVVAWQGSDASTFGVSARRFNSSGVAQGNEFPVNVYTTLTQGNPAVAMDSSGNFVVVWHGRGAGDDFGVFGRRYSASGSPIGGEFRANSFTTGFQGEADVASDVSGNFMVVWTSATQDSGTHGVFAQRYDSTGATQGVELRVNTFAPNVQRHPAVAWAPDGRFVVVWDSADQDGNLDGVFGQRYDGSGTKQGAEFQVNGFTTNSQQLPRVAADAAGNFVVAWESALQDGSGLGVFARRYEHSGVPPIVDLQVNSYTSAHQQIGGVATVAGGRFVVTWASAGQDGDSLGVFAQRFAPDVIFEDGFE